VSIPSNTDVDLVNSGDTPYEITVTPSQCCLFIEENDIDCEVCKHLIVNVTSNKDMNM